MALEALKSEIEALGNKIRSLKEEGQDVSGAVKELLEKKQLYADSNGGIGVDGKPVASKKKEKVPEEAGPPKQAQDPNSKGAQKKAAKKAAKLAKKQAMKDGGDISEEVASPSPAIADQKAPSAPPVSVVQETVANPVPVALKKNLPPVLAPAGSLQPLQMAINPNVPLTDRPIVALAVAVLSNTSVDLELISDHKRRHTALGMEEGGMVSGDLAMARYLARRAKAEYLLPQSCPSAAAIIDTWIDYAQSLSLMEETQRMKALAMTLHHNLTNRTYLVGHSITMADLAVFAAAGFPTQHADLEKVLSLLPHNATVAKRYVRMLASHPALQQATQLAVGVVSNAEAIFDPSQTLEPLVKGMNTLEGATPGRVVTRFPPEPSGYLHIGHSKAALLNDYYAKRYKGRLLLRFDDTNPSKEKEEYQESIIVDLAKLGIKPDTVTYTSDYLNVISGYAKQLILDGNAFMDDTPQDQMQKERMERVESKNRSQTPDEALKYFDLMCSGDPEGASWCLRAKIDMKSNNGTLRDPVLFRQNLEPHHRTGTKYKAYPTYDLACPIVDSIEGVTHALRTTEYNDRDAQYQWILKALGLRQVRIHAFSRVNFVNTVLSKRKLTWFVEKGHVDGWDDPRFPTVRGVVRRGVSITALRDFMTAQGASRNVVSMDWSVFWAENKKEMDKSAKRFMAIDKTNNVELTILNGPPEGTFAFKETPYHPKDPSMGSRAIRISRKVLLETIDMEGVQVDEHIVLLRWGVVKITNVEGGLQGEYIPDGDFRSAKRKVSWIASVKQNTPVVLTEFDHYLITKDKLGDEDDVADFVNPHTKATTFVIGDPGLKNLKENDVIQLERRGFYRVDRPYVSEKKPIVLFMVPDGKTKSMGGLVGKLSHR